MNIDSPVCTVKGVGTERQKYLGKLNIETVRDILCHYPRDYEDRSKVTPIAELSEDRMSVIVAFTKDAPKTSYFRGMATTQVKVYDKSGDINVIWYNQPYAKNIVKPNAMYAFIGRLTVKNNRRYIATPEVEALNDTGEWNGGIVPVYPLTAGLSQKVFRKIVYNVLAETEDQITEYIPAELRKRYKLSGRTFAIKNIHEPVDMDSYELARKRLVFDEFFMLQMLLLRIKTVNDSKSAGIKIKKIIMKPFFNILPFAFTEAQNKVFKEIEADMIKGKVMNRLVQGDVGSGKTAVAMAAAYLTVKNGLQTVMMAPTEVLASQHFESFKNIFDPIGIKVLLLTGGLKTTEKREALQKIVSGEVDIILGTHALIQDKVEFSKIGLVITDEQHRFGVRQRQMLSDKGDNPHTLVMTATPIPRTLALILYGDLDISIIDGMPPGRQKICTYSVNTSFRSRIYSFIDKQVECGRQAYVICPMVEENENIEAESVVEYAEKLKETVLAKRTIAFVHGRMKSEEKEIILKNFALGKINILISTTVIEVGINVPNATVMLIENAERFGLAQLHQLRGRVGRGDAQSYCILLTDGKGKITSERMKVMTTTTDGFVISETDLKLRGPGEFFGTRQHGLPNLKIANMYSDMHILKDAQSAAHQIIACDENLEKAENYELKKELDRFIISTNLGI